MAGGEGTRLRPLTCNQPKPLMPVANKALMEHVLALLRRHGFTDIVVTVAFQANAIQTYFGNGSEFGVRLTYASEDVPLGTAGSVRNAMHHLDEPFLVISGDVLTDIDLAAVVREHNDRGALATIALKAVPNPLELGIVMTRPDGSVERFLEKPSWGQVFSDTINTGIYVFQPEIFDYIPAGAADFSCDVFPKLLGGRKLLYGSVTEGYWEDIGTLDAYARAHQDILDGRVSVELCGFSLRDGIWLGAGAEVGPGAQLEGPAIIGEHSKVDAGAVLGEYSVLGRNVRVGSDAFLERAIVHDNVFVGPGVRLRGCTVGRGSDLRRGARVEEGAVVGDECFIGEHAVVHSGVKVYPFKTVEHGAVVNASIVWGSRGARKLFGRNGVAGLANVDVSPELVVRLAMAYATTMPKGARVAVSRDTSRAARALKQSVVVGLNSAGVDVADLDVTTVPVTRFGVRSERCAGGVTVRLSQEDPESVVVGFIGPDGTDMGEAAQRKVERIFYREDFRRCLASEMGDVSFPVQVPDLYSQVLSQQVDTDAVRAAKLKVVLDYAYGAASSVMPSVLGRLGAEVLSANSYAAAHQAVSYDRWEHTRGVSSLVKASRADLGAVLSPDGERVTLVDDNGRALSDSEGLLALLTLVMRGAAGSAERRQVVQGDRLVAAGPSSLLGSATGGTLTVAMPVSAGQAVESLCREAGAGLVWTKLAASSVMEAAAQPGVDFAAGQEGGYIFPRFLPAFDGVAALAQTFSLLATTGLRLSQVVAELPSFYCAHEGVVTPWEKKGFVMRSVMAMGEGRSVVLVDGVKILHDDGWCLVLPDPDEALTHVWAEAASEAATRGRAQEYARRVRALLRG